MSNNTLKRNSVCLSHLKIAHFVIFYVLIWQDGDKMPLSLNISLMVGDQWHLVPADNNAGCIHNLTQIDTNAVSVHYSLEQVHALATYNCC
jgi:hypothetical protein